MNKVTGIALLVVGVVVLAFGFDARGSFSSDVSRAFNGAPSDKAMWLLGIGAFLTVAGVAAMFRGGSRRAID